MAEIPCPACRRALHAPEGCAGLPVECAECGHRFIAPPATGAPDAPAADDDTADAPERFRRPPQFSRGALAVSGGLVAVLAALAVLAWLGLRWLGARP